VIENASSGIVLLAQTFNPSIFTETWLYRNGLVPEDKLVGMRVFSSEVAQFQTTDVQVLVIPPKMQILFGILGPCEFPDLPRKIATKTVELLPQTSYQALGINFDFFVTQPADVDFLTYDRDLLGTGDYSLIQEFSSADCRFGRYFSKDFKGSRLKLDIKPVKAGPKNQDLIQFSFNFHYDVAETDAATRTEKLAALINSWDELRQYAQVLVDLGSRLRERNG